jgi:iron complex transport system substrate-binding protein
VIDAQELRKFLVIVALATGAGGAIACPRIVSQSPYITRALEWFGRADCIVGVSRYDAGPLPRTGGVFDPDAAAIAALKPDLVISPDWIAADVLQKAVPPGARVLRLGGFHSMEDAEAMLRELGKAAEVGDVDARVGEFHRRWQEAAARLDGHSRRALIISACTGTPYSYGRGTTLNDLLRRAGFVMVEDRPGVHMLAGDDALETQVTRLAPELVIALGQRTADSCQMISIDAKVRIVHVDSGLFDHPGPLLLDGLEQLREELSHE